MIFAASIWSVVANAFSQSDSVGKLIVLGQVAMLLFSLSLMLAKWSERKKRQKRSQTFVNAFVATNDPLALYYNNEYAFDKEAPMESVYLCACKRFCDLIPESQRLLLRSNPSVRIDLAPARMDLVETTARHAVNEACQTENWGMTMLSIFTASAPLLGLFGTVWGIMLAFNAMAEQGAADIAALAPGISSALLTTVIGLVVAIPCTVAYNLSAAGIEQACTQYEDFAEELMGKLVLNYQSAERE